MPRRVYAIGQANVPETSGERNASLRHLDAVWGLMSQQNRLWYNPSRPGAMDGPAGSGFALYALRYAANGTACEGMDPRITHVESLAGCMSDGVSIKKIIGCGPVRLMLLTNGHIVTLSSDRTYHGMKITLPGGVLAADVAGGEGHYVVCDTAGSVYTWGWNNEYGQLGNGRMTAPDTSLIGVHAPEKLNGFGETDEATVAAATTVFEARKKPLIAAVACGRHHSVLLTASRTCVYTFGRGHRGQLGHGRPTQSQLAKVELLPTPRAVPNVFGHEVEQLCCPADGDSTMLRLANGTIVAWGDNTNGFFGLGHTKSVDTPTALKFSEAAGAPRPSQRTRLPVLDTATGNVTAVHLACSSTHAAVVDSEHNMRTAGLRPVRVSKTMAIDALGPLGRRLQHPKEAIEFREVGGLLVEEGDEVVCGNGYTAYLMRRQGLVFLLGTISEGGKVVIGGEEAHDLLCINTGVERRVDTIVPAVGGGLLLVVDSVA